MAVQPRLVSVAALFATLVALGGCQSVAERRVGDEAQCRAYGFRPGTDGFAGCLQSIDLDRSADRRQFLDRPYGWGGGYGGAIVGSRRGWW